MHSSAARAAFLAMIVCVLAIPAFAASTDDFDKGIAAYRANDYVGATAAFTKAVDSDPKIANYQSWLGYVLVLQGKYAESVAPLQKAAALNPKDSDTWSNLGTAYLSIAEKDKAVEAYGEAVKLRPGSAVCLYNLGNAYLDAGKYPEAEQWLRKALAASPNDANISVNLGLALQKQGKTTEAIAVWKAGLEHNPDSSALLTNLGIAYKAAGDPAAQETLEHAANADKGSAYPRVALGEMLASKGKTDDAIAHYQAASEIDPGDFVAHYNLGALYSAQGKNDLAAQEFQKALDIKPNDVDVMCELGWALASSGREQDGINHLQAAVALDPTSLRARKRLAIAYKVRAENGPAESKPAARKMAIRAWSEVLKLESDPVDHYIIANLYREDGEISQASAHYREAIKEDQTSAQSRLALGYILMDEHKTDEAIAQFKAAVAEPSASKSILAAAHNDLGVAYESKSRGTSAVEKKRYLKLAKEEYLRATSLDKNHPDATYNLERLPQF